MAILKAFEKELKNYCASNSLDYNKAITFPRCGNEEVLFIQRVNREKGKKTMGGTNPAEILISAKKDSEGLIWFEQGENASKYLGL